ncbi:MAG: RNA polymerase subunit sigma [Bacillota bacterium]|nr:RNA polymerase subunit sigma [Bacillota bacterium]
MRDLDQMAVSAAADERVLNELISINETYILQCASRATHRYITKSDDEWSLALSAFTNAVNTYDLKKGSFLGFANVVIKRKLIDYYRSNSKKKNEIVVNPAVFNTDPEDYDDDLAIYRKVVEQKAQDSNDQLKVEIEAANETFSQYGFSFFDLTGCSPKAGKTQKACAKAISFLVQNTFLIQDMRLYRQLPIKEIEKSCKIPRKILERHRRYIIAAIEILTGDYPCLGEYMESIKKEIEHESCYR